MSEESKVKPLTRPTTVTKTLAEVAELVKQDIRVKETSDFKFSDDGGGHGTRTPKDAQVQRAQQFVSLVIEKHQPSKQGIIRAEELVARMHEYDRTVDSAFKRDTCFPSVYLQGRPLVFSQDALDKLIEAGFKVPKSQLATDMHKGEVKVSRSGDYVNVSGPNRKGEQTSVDLTLKPTRGIDLPFEYPDFAEQKEVDALWQTEAGFGTSMVRRMDKGNFGQNAPLSVYEQLYVYALTSSNLEEELRIQLLFSAMLIAGPWLSRQGHGIELDSDGQPKEPELATRHGGSFGPVRTVDALRIWLDGRRRPGRKSPEWSRFFVINAERALAGQLYLDAQEQDRDPSVIPYLEQELGLLDISSTESPASVSIKRQQAQLVEAEKAALASGMSEDEVFNLKLSLSQSYLLLPFIEGRNLIPSVSCVLGMGWRLQTTINSMQMTVGTYHRDLRAVRFDFFSRVVVEGYEGYNQIKDVGLTVEAWMRMNTPAKPIVTLVEATTDKDILYSYEWSNVKDYALEVTVSDLLDGEKIEDVCAKVSPKLFGIASDLSSRLKLPESNLEAWDAQTHLNNFCSFAAWLLRQSEIGFGVGVGTSPCATVTTRARVQHLEGGMIDHPGWERHLQRAFDLLEDRPRPPKRAEGAALIQNTSSGHGTKSKFAVDGQVLVNGTAVSIDMLSSNRKTVAGVLTAPVTMLSDKVPNYFDTEAVAQQAKADEEVLSYLRSFGTFGQPGTLGVRQDPGKKARIIYLIPTATLLVQLGITRALKKYQKGKPMFANENSNGSTTQQQISQVEQLHSCQEVVDTTRRQRFVSTTDFPSWDTHQTTILRAMLAASRESKFGPPTPWRSALERLLEVYTGEEGALFRVQVEDSDAFVSRGRTITSGDSWTSSLNSFVHAQIFEVLKQLLNDFNVATDEQKLNGSWCTTRRSNWDPDETPHEPWMREGEEVAVPFAQAQFTILPDSIKVFGDDGIFTVESVLTGERNKEDIPEAMRGAVRTFNVIRTLTVQITGNGSSAADLQASSTSSNFLNVSCFAVLYRRSRQSFTTERPKAVSPADAMDKALGALVAGEPIKSYEQNLMRTLVTQRTTSIFGRSLEVTPATALAPYSGNSSFYNGSVTVQPYPMSPFVYRALNPDQLPVGLPITELDPDDEIDIGERVLQMTKAYQSTVSNKRQPEQSMRSALTAAQEAWSSDKRVFPAQQGKHETRTLVKLAYERNAENAVAEGLYLGMSEPGAVYARKLQVAERRTARNIIYRNQAIEGRIDMTIGISSTISIEYSDRVLQVDESGLLSAVVLGAGGYNHIPLRKLQPSLWGGFAIEYATTLSILGATIASPQSFEPAMAMTGAPYKIGHTKVARVLNEMKASNETDVRYVLRRLGFTATEASTIWAGKEHLKVPFIESLDTYASWRSALIPELTLGGRWLFRTPQLHPSKELVDPDSEDDPANNSILKGLAEDIWLAFTANEVFATVSQIYASMRLEGVEPTMSEFLRIPRRLGNLPYVTITKRA